jgi:hypothetical protein
VAATLALWSPPEGMAALDVTAWRTFYSRILDAYGVTPADYRLLYVAQKGRCWICRTAKGIHPDDPKARGSRRLGVDHDHLTGAVRGLLCTGSLSANTCNRLIGRYGAGALRRAADYLENRSGIAGRPARIFPVLRREIADAEAAGTQLTQAEVDALAVALLWSEDVR